MAKNQGKIISWEETVKEKPEQELVKALEKVLHDIKEDIPNMTFRSGNWYYYSSIRDYIIEALAKYKGKD